MIKIAIIGGGLSGTLSALSLLKQRKNPVSLHMFEQQQTKVGRGVAYSSKLSHQLLNVPASHMSVFPDIPDDFCNWLLEQGFSHTSHDFVPRYLFGDYVRQRLHEQLALAGPHRLQITTTTVEAVSRSGSRYNLITDQQKTYGSFDQLILCTGNFPPADIPFVSEEVRQSACYIANPWSGDATNAIDRNATVLIVGSGLSMADQVLSLQQNGHLGKIVVLSRRGLLPRAHGPSPLWQLTTVPSLHNLQLLEVLRWVKQEIILAEAAGSNWRSVVNALREITPSIWGSLTEPDKQRFMRHLRPFWEIHRHRLPEASYQALAAMQAAGQLQVIAGRIKGCLLLTNKLLVNVLPRSKKQTYTLEVSRLINCTGPQSHHKKIGSSLFQNLRSQGLISIDELGMGIQVSENYKAIEASGKVNNSFHIIGPPAKGTLWECTALREIRQQAFALPQKLFYNEISLALKQSI